MIWIFVFLLLLLFLTNIKVANSLLYPPVVFTGVWLLALFVLALAQSMFYAVSMETFAIYWIGALAFSIGGFSFLSMSKVRCIAGRYYPKTEKAFKVTLNVSLAVVVLVLPFYILRATEEISLLDPLYFVTRRAMDIEADRPYNPLGNFVVLSKFVAMAMHLENSDTTSGKWTTWAAILVAIFYSVLEGAKMGAVMIVLTLMFISFIRGGKVNWLLLAKVAVLLTGFFLAGLAVVNFAYADSVNMNVLIQTMVGYWVGPLVAFDTVVRDPLSIEAVHKLTRFFVETANSLGAGIPSQSIHAKFANISPEIEGINTYTLYFAYYREHSWPGVVLGMVFLGYLLTFVYVQARSKSSIAILIYGMAMTGLVLCTHGEQFWLSLNPYVKAVGFFYLLYIILPRIRIYAR
jgi:oligosaccharide repeat unit polymerase